MTTFIILLLVGATIGGFVLMKRRTHRRHLLSSPIPDSWEKILDEKFQVYSCLPEDIKRKLGGMTAVFIDEKKFEACGGLDAVTEEMRVVVAAQACLLLTGLKKHGFFPRLKSILIYPDAYRDRRRRTFSVDAGDDDHVRLGESWDSGSVVLSWKSVLAGAANDDDGMNVVYHEFAHQLDQINGRADGAPKLPNGGDYAQWAKVFSREYERLVEAANQRRSNTLLDTYGATNPAEFFAVATEALFEQPHDLKKKHRELFDEMTGYFGVDPTVWMD